MKLLFIHYLFRLTLSCVSHHLNHNNSVGHFCLQTIDAYGAGSEALKSARKEGPSLDDMDTLMGELDEVNEGFR
jgi:hypothetical protein